MPSIIHWIVWVLLFIHIFRNIFKRYKLKNPEVWANIFSFLTCGIVGGWMYSEFFTGFLQGILGAAVPSLFRFTANKKSDENADN